MDVKDEAERRIARRIFSDLGLRESTDQKPFSPASDSPIFTEDDVVRITKQILYQIEGEETRRVVIA